MYSADKYIKNALSGFFTQREISQYSLIILNTLYNISQTDILLGRDNINDIQISEIDNIICELKNHRPIQYILGSTLFLGLNFAVKEGVLIPRPETAELIELIISQNTITSPTILDIGTGSGIIAVSLAHYIKGSKVTAFDISDKAIAVAKENSRNNNVDVDIIKTDILNFDSSNFENKFDIIVSNPPYICNEEKNDMSTNVLDFEPHIALFVEDNDPLIFYRTIVNHSTKMLNSKGKLYFEINERFGCQTAQLLKDAGFSEVSIIKDMQQKDRIVFGILG